MPQKRPYKRSHYFVEKEYQFKFILKFCLIVIGGTLLSTVLLLLFSQGTLTSSFENSRLVLRNTASAILPEVILTNMVTLLFITSATVVTVLFISHKIAGPMFRFEKELKKIGQGDLTINIVLRKNDQFKNMAESLNTMTEGLKTKVVDVQKELEQILESARKEKYPERLIDDMEHLHQSIHRYFKV